MNQQQDDSVQQILTTARRNTARRKSAPVGWSDCSRYLLPACSLVCGLALLFTGSHLQAQPGSAKKTAKSGKADPKNKTEVKKQISIPASERLPSMNIKKPLISKARFDLLTTKMKTVRVNTVLARGRITPRSRQIIKDWAEWRILGMTLPEQQDKLFNTRKKLLNEVKLATRLLKGAPPPPKEPFRKMICQEVTQRCTQVLHNNYYVRLHAIIVLGNLNLLEYDPVAKVKRLPTAYGPAYKPLLNVLTDTKQPVSLKIAATAGLKRIALLARHDNVRLREVANRELARGLVEQFEGKKLHTWYQRRLAQALGSVDLQKTPDGKAVIIQALAEAIVNNAGTRTVPVQSAAAMALGRAALAPDVNIDLLMWELVQLSRDMAVKYNADLAKKGKLASHWTSSFLRVYFAFQAVDRLERDFLFKGRRALKDRYPGFLAKKLPQDAAVKDAYAQIKPLVTHVASQSEKAVKAPVPTATLAGLDTWLKSHRPKNFQVQNGVGLPPLRVLKAVLAKPKARNGNVGGP